MRRLILPDGSITDFAYPLTCARIASLLKADTLDTFRLRDAGDHVAMVDDAGHQKGLPINSKATEMYLATCRPGTTHVIRGPVFVCPDMDFAP